MTVLWMIGLWSLPVFVAIGGGVLIYIDGTWRHQARIDAANTEVREAVQEADGWIKEGSAKDGENVEQRLMTAIAAKDVAEEVEADAVLERVRTRRADLAADSLFDSAKVLLDAKGIVEAVALLERYIADGHATKKPEAEQLLADFDLATSESAAIETLVMMSDEQFDQFSNTGKLDDGTIRHPVLVEIRATTLLRNLETAGQSREEIKLAEANRQEEELKLAEANRQQEEIELTEAVRQESERLALAAGVWRHKPGKSEPAEMTLHPNGKINNPDGQSTWTLTEKTLVLRWADPKAPGGFWIDTCTISDDGKTYSGVNQANTPIAGWKVIPPVAVNELSPEEAAELIRTKLVGNWRWGEHDGGVIMQFSQDGTFVEAASGGSSFSGGITSQGLWNVEPDGAIRLSGDRRKDFPVVTINLNEDVIFVEYTKFRTKARASRYNVKHEITEANLAGVWVYFHPAALEQSVEINLLPDGKIGDPNGPNTWTLNGTTLVLRWADRKASDGFRVDTCTVWWGWKGERLHYRGINQRKVLVGGYKGNLPPWFEKRRQEILSTQASHAVATRERRARIAEEDRLALEAAGKKANAIWKGSGSSGGGQASSGPKRQIEQRRDGMGAAGTAAGTQGGGAKPNN